MSGMKRLPSKFSKIKDKPCPTCYAPMKEVGKVGKKILYECDTHGPPKKP